MLGIRVIASPAAAAGFRLAGIASDEVANPADIAPVLARRSREKGLGILIVEQQLLDAAPDGMRREAERSPVPILVPVPSARLGSATTDAEGLIVELLRRAIGYRVKLK